MSGCNPSTYRDGGLSADLPACGCRQGDRNEVYPSPLGGIAWRLRRIPAFEAAILETRCAEADNYVSS